MSQAGQDVCESLKWSQWLKECLRGKDHGMASALDVVRDLFPCRRPDGFVNGMACPGFLLFTGPTPAQAPTEVPCFCTLSKTLCAAVVRELLREAPLPEPDGSARWAGPWLAWQKVPSPPVSLVMARHLMVALGIRTVASDFSSSELSYLKNRRLTQIQQGSRDFLERLLRLQALLCPSGTRLFTWDEIRAGLAPGWSNGRERNALREDLLGLRLVVISMGTRLLEARKSTSSATGQRPDVRIFEELVTLLSAQGAALVVFSTQPLLPARTEQVYRPDFRAKRVREVGQQVEKPVPPVIIALRDGVPDKLFELLERGQEILDGLGATRTRR